MNKSTNPILKSILKKQQESYYLDNTNIATYKGILIKGIILSFLLIFSSILSTILINKFLLTGYGYNQTFLTVSIIISLVSFILLLVAQFKIKTAKYITPIYLLGQGYIIGLLNAVVLQETGSPVLGITAGVATLVVFLVMFLIHTLKIFRITTKVRKVMFGILFSFLIMSLISTIVFFATEHTVSEHLGLSPMAQYGLAIAINVFVIIIASIFLLIDFDNADIIVRNGLSKDYEWVFLIGLFITLIWIYFKIFQLLVLIFANRK